MIKKLLPIFLVLLLSNGAFGQKNAEITDFDVPKGQTTRGSILSATVTIKNTGDSKETFWIGLSFAHEDATNENWPIDWNDIKPKSIELTVGQEKSIEFDRITISPYAKPGQYYARASVWDDFDTETWLMVGTAGVNNDDRFDDTTYDRHPDHPEWRDSETGETSYQLGAYNQPPDNFIGQLLWATENIALDGRDILDSYLNQGIKPLFYFSLSGGGNISGVTIEAGATILIDLADLLEKTPEGKDWVTMWIDVEGKLGIGVDSPSLSVETGILCYNYGLKNWALADDRRKWASGLGANIAGFAISLLHYDSEEGWKKPKIQWTGNAGLSLKVEGSIDGLKSWEVNVGKLKEAFNEAFSEKRSLGEAIITLSEDLTNNLFVDKDFVRNATWDDGSRIISNGKAITELKLDSTFVASSDEEQYAHHFKIKVPYEATELKVITSGGAIDGNTDLYVKYGGRPDIDGEPFYKSENSGNNEGISIKYPDLIQGGEYFIMMPSISPYQDVELRAATLDDFNNINPVLSNVTLSPKVGNENTDFKFTAHYSDADGDAPLPGEATLHIFGAQNKAVQMTLESSTAYNGTYSYSTKLPIGNYSYKVSFLNNANQVASTEFLQGPRVHNSTSMTIIPYFSCGVDETYDTHFSYIINNEQSNGYLLKVGKNEGFEIPPEGSVHLNLSGSENFEFENYQLIQEGKVVWDSGGSSSGFTFTEFVSGTFELRINFSYTPQNYKVSGTINNEDNTSYANPITISLGSSQENRIITSSDGTFNFENVKGGIPVEIMASGVPVGYTINPENFPIKNLRKDQTFRFTVSADDHIAPVVTVIERPDEISSSSGVSFVWIGSDDITAEANLLYQYKLEGVDDSWSSWNDNKTAIYNLPNGIYKFIINSKDEAGNVNNVPVEFSFIVNANPKIEEVEKFDKGIWASKITVSTDGSETPSNSVVLLPAHSLTNLKSIVPIRLYRLDETNPIGSLDRIAVSLDLDTVFVSQNDGFIFNIPDDFPESNVLEYIIEWGNLASFGWQKRQSIPSGFPNLSNTSPFRSDITEDKYLDDNHNLWRVAISKKRIETDDKYIYNSWAYFDKSNTHEVIIKEKEIEYIEGSWTSGEIYTRPEAYEAKILNIGNKEYFVIREEKYERTYPTSGYLNTDYGRYVIKIINSDGSEFNSAFGDWRKNVSYSLPNETIHNNIWLSSRFYDDSNKSISFTIIDAFGNKLIDDLEYYKKDRSHRIDDRGVFPIGNDNVLLIFEDEWETVNRDDRQNLYFQIRGAHGALVKSTTRLNPPLSDDTLEKNDEYQFENALTDNLGRVWISYSHYVKDSGDEYFYTIIDTDGSILVESTPTTDERRFISSDLDGYVWATEGSLIYLIDEDFNQEVFNLDGFIKPNQKVGINLAKVDYDGYTIFDRWSSNTFSVNIDVNTRFEKTQFFSLPLNDDIKLKDIKLEINGSEIINIEGALPDFSEDDISASIELGSNGFSIDQNALLGGEMVIAFPIVFNLPPTDIGLNPASIEENNVVGDEVGIFTTIDEDVEDEHTYSFVDGDNDNGSFTIDGDKLKAREVFDFETKANYTVKVRTVDSGDEPFEKEFIITINDINEAPTDISLDPSSIDENNEVGDIVGTFITTDEDAEDSHTYSFVDGDNDNGSFTIDGDKLKAAKEFDFETKTNYTVKVRTVDSGDEPFEKEFIITINDINEAPTDIILEPTSLDENNEIDDPIGVFNTIDEDANESQTYSFVSGTGDTDNTSFKIVGDQLMAAEVFDFEGKPTYDILLQVEDKGGLTYLEPFTI